MKGGKRRAPRELGRFLGLGGVLGGRRRRSEEESEAREGGERDPFSAQYPVAVSVELGRAKTLSVIGTLPIRSSSPSRRATVADSRIPLT